MADLIGQTLSHYRITSALGAGGMGEVYRATDLNLHRDVAIKVLPPEVAQDPERLGRFQREAHLLAALNHPSIAAIYGLEEANGKPFLALELVEGEDLKERLSRGAIPVDEALEIAKQIAEALEEAHNKGIVHRDLKPANVKLTPDGRVKVLDFGLAKAWAGDASGVNSGSAALSQSPTLAHTGTIAGVILGTAAYMSPEQARGKPVDRRADVWSFGVLLWEMLTGRSLFAGDTVTDVIAAVVKEEPDLDALPKATPRAVRRLLSRCLRKDPRMRLPDIGSARLELQEVLAGASAEPGAPAAEGLEATRDAARRRSRERWAWAAALLVATGLAAAFAFVHLAQVPERPAAARFAADAPEGWSFAEFGWPVPSPDGRQVAFLAQPARPTGATAQATLWIRSLESLAARPLAGTEGAEGIPFWSPDGRSIGFLAGGELRRLTLADGAVQRICATPDSGYVGADWNREGTILFSAGGWSGRIYAVAATGGEAKPLTTLDASRGETSHHMPQFLPDGRRFLFVINAAKPEHTGLFVATLDAPAERRPVAPGWLRCVHAAGHLLFARDGTLFAQPFDATRAERSGEPVAIAASVASWDVFPALGWFGVSPGGTLASFSGSGAPARVQLAWLDRKGGQVGTVGAPGPYGQLALSPDERTLAFEMADGVKGQSDLWVMDVARGVPSRVTVTPGNEYDPVWAPDGRSLAFGAERDGTAAVWRKGLRASEPETVLVDTPDQDFPEFWSGDGGTLLFLRLGNTGATEIVKSAWALPLGGGDPTEVLRTVASRIDEPQLSPDGRWLAYMSDDSGRYEVYVEPFGRDGDRVRVSVDGGGQPRWRGDGRELFYATPTGRLMAVAVRAAGDRPEVSLPVELFEIRGMRPSGEFDEYAASRDGQRFLVKLPVERASTLKLHVVTNWTSLLSTEKPPAP